VTALPRHPSRIGCLTFSPDSRTLLTIADASALNLWDVKTGRPRHDLPGHRDRLISVGFSTDGRAVVTASWDGGVRLWDAATGKEQLHLEVRGTYHPGMPYVPTLLGDARLSPDGKLLAVARGDSLVVLYDVRTKKEVRQFKAHCFAFAPGGKEIACGEEGPAYSGPIRVYDLATGKRLREMLGHKHSLTGLVYSPDGQTLHSREIIFRTMQPGETNPRFARAWDARTGEPRRGLPGAPTALAISPDGRTAASVERGGKSVVLTEVASGQRRIELKCLDRVFRVAISPDGRLLACGGMDGAVWLWELPSGRLVTKLIGHRSWVQSIAFSPDGKRLVSGGLDTTALVWDLTPYLKRPAGKALTAAEAERCWQGLASDAAVAYGALAQLFGSADGGAAAMRSRLKAPALDAKRIERLIADLGSETFGVRDKAARELEELGDRAELALREGMKRNDDVEVKRRLGRLLEKLARQGPSKETLRHVRAVEALELHGSAEARRLLDALAKGPALSRLTHEAKAARLRKR
jgi:WD40 repeat protein